MRCVSLHSLITRRNLLNNQPRKIDTTNSTCCHSTTCTLGGFVLLEILKVRKCFTIISLMYQQLEVGCSIDYLHSSLRDDPNYLTTPKYYFALWKSDNRKVFSAVVVSLDMMLLRERGFGIIYPILVSPHALLWHYPLWESAV